LKISIGILAYNEAAEIGTTLHSLFEQNIFKQPETYQKIEAIEIVVVPNGCTDNTAAISRETLLQLVESSTHPNISWQVYEVEQPGKPNAWNLYVHEYSNPAADYLIVMDADIQLLEGGTLDALICTLEEKPDAWVSVDMPIKDVALKQKTNLIEKLSLSVSKVTGAKSAWISQLYCCRPAILRNIWMPLGVIVEDGFLWSMIVTNSLTSPTVVDRVVRADSASHAFEAYIDIKSLLRHEVRQVMGNTINAFLYEDLRANCLQPEDLGLLVKKRNEQEPLWVNKLIQAAMAKRGWWVVDRFMLLRRILGLQYAPLKKAILLSPVAGLAFVVDLLVCLQANIELHKWSKSSSGETQAIDNRYWRLDW
jgi:glycosyltransferase involved in cell wall biosynthesis